MSSYNGWPIVELNEVAEVRLGRQRSPKNHAGPRMRPYLRAANVTWSGLNLSDVKEMNFTEAESAIYELRRGDVVVSEASGSAGEVGKAALWREEIEGCCFQNTLLRVRPGDSVLPTYILHYLRYQARIGELGKAARGVGIHHIGAKRLSAWLVPVPPIEEQQRLVEALERGLADCLGAQIELKAALARTEALEQSLMWHAFAGKLVPHDADVEAAAGG